MLMEREKPGYGCFRNSYWQISLFSIKGRAVPWLPLLVYLAYTSAVCVGATHIPGFKQVRPNPPSPPPRGGQRRAAAQPRTAGSVGARAALRQLWAGPRPPSHPPARRLGRDGGSRSGAGVRRITPSRLRRIAPSRLRHLPLSPSRQMDELKQLSSVTTTIGALGGTQRCALGHVYTLGCTSWYVYIGKRIGGNEYIWRYT
jgi:hypothetical protein